MQLTKRQSARIDRWLAANMDGTHTVSYAVDGTRAIAFPKLPDSPLVGKDFKALADHVRGRCAALGLPVKRLDYTQHLTATGNAVCDVCGLEFVPHKASAKRCPMCRMRNRKPRRPRAEPVALECQWCGSAFLVEVQDGQVLLRRMPQGREERPWANALRGTSRGNGAIACAQGVRQAAVRGVRPVVHDALAERGLLRGRVPRRREGKAAQESAFHQADGQVLGKHAKRAVCGAVWLHRHKRRLRHMREIIPVDGTMRIRRVDKMNWTVEKHIVSKDGNPRWEQVNGTGKGPFAGKPDSPVIVRCLLDNAPELDGFEGTMREYAKAVDRAGKRIAASIANGGA